MGGGFMFAAANSAATPPLPITVSFPTPPAVCADTNLCYCSQNDAAFGLVPSRVEVETAILQLQRFMDGILSTGSELEGHMHHDHLKMMQSPGFIKFSEAFALMQAEPPLQKLVVSISCDEAVWKAILSNKAVNDLQGSISAAKEEKRLSYSKDEEEEEVILRWMLGFTKSKIFQLLENFASVVNEIFRPTPKENPTTELHDLLDEKVRSSLLLSVVILLIVVFARGHDFMIPTN